jgi:plastocyanin
MRKLTISALIAATALLALPVPGGTASAATVSLGDNFFAPSSKTIGKGSKVRFNWTGRRRHNVTKASGPGVFFASKTTKRRGVNFAKRFSKRGSYLLYCSLHPSQMRLTLRVR